jgi:hypothetical protein
MVEKIRGIRRRNRMSCVAETEAEDGRRVMLTRNRGMQTIWVMGNETEVLDKVPRPEVKGYLTYGGDVYGNESHWPTVVHYFDSWAENQ